MKLILRVENVNEVVPALPVHCVFSQRGGLIGSDPGSDWQIQDLNGTIAESAARVVIIDDHFTIEALNGAELFVNGATAPITSGRPVILADKDSLRIGHLSCRVDTGGQAVEAGQGVGSMASFAAQSSDGQEALVIDGEFKEAPTLSQDASLSDLQDPLDAIDGALKQSSTLDPLEALQMSKTETVVNGTVPSKEVKASAFDGANAPNASLMPRKFQKDRFGFEEFDTSSEDAGLSAELRAQSAKIDLDQPVDHVALRPLARALGIPLGDMSAEQAQRMLADMGGTLRAAVSGVNEVYKRRDTAGSKFPLTTLHMHAVEDNPLRFGKDADDALHAMFTKRGAVHLNPAPAMREAMDHFTLHQEATEQAIDRALDAVLAALSPKALNRRFRSYIAEDSPMEDEEQDAWLWGMYKAYFNELRSQRQRGLQMLFWEYFQHEYQAILRQHELFNHEEDL